MEELFAKYYNELMLYVISLCRNKHVAEEVVSTAFFRALQSTDGEVSSFKAWLFVVARNEYFSLCRKKKHLVQAPFDERIAREEAEMLDGILRDEEYRALHRAIMLLPDAQREAIDLFYFFDQSIRDIAQIMEKSEGSVKVLLHRARKNLKSILEEI